MGKAIPLAILFIILILGVIGGGVYYFTNQNPTEATGLPPTCAITTSGSTTNSYTCPSGVDSCQATLKMTCNTQSNVPRVVARTDDFNFGGGWLAYDNGFGGLNSYIFESSVIINGLPQGVLNQKVTSAFTRDVFIGNDNAHIYIRKQETAPSNEICNCGGANNYPTCSEGTIKTSSYTGRCGVNSQSTKYCIVCTEPNFYQYKSAGGANINPQQINNCQGTEVCDNANSYQCSQQITGSITRTVTYSGATSGTKNEIVSLSSGQTINWNGQYGNSITYIATDNRNSECTQNQVDDNNAHIYYICSLDANNCGVLNRNNPQDCEDVGNGYIYDEVKQMCQPPYGVDLILTKNVFGLSETITGTVKITDTTQKQGIPITIILYKDNQAKATTPQVSTNSRGEINFNLQGQNIAGSYKVVARIDHPLGSLEESTNIGIEVPISMSVSVDEYTTIQYIPNPVRVKVRITNGDNFPEDVDSLNYDGTVCGTKSYAGEVLKTRLSTGIYLLETPVDEECTFVYKVKATDSGYATDVITSPSIQVKRASILIDPDYTSVEGKDEGNLVMTFKTLDANLQPISTNVQVTIKDTDNCNTGQYCIADGKTIPAITTSPVTGQAGTYRFTHYWKEGINELTISASASGIQSNTLVKPITIFSSDNPLPITGGGGTNWGLIIGGIVIVGGVALFFYFILRRKRRK